MKGSMFKKKRSGAYDDLATEAVRQGLLDGLAHTKTSGSALLDLDGFLGTYEQVDVDWRAIWREANRNRDRIPTFGLRPYWLPGEPGGPRRPLSALAFWPVSDRLRIAQDPTTDPTMLRLMAGDRRMTGVPDPDFGDPDPSVFRAAVRAMRSAPQIEQLPPSPPGEPEATATRRIQGVDETRFRAYVVRQLTETDFLPWADRAHSMLVPAEVLIDLLLASVPPEASGTLLADINSDLARGDRTARYEKQILDHWTACKMTGRMTSISDVATDEDVDGLIRASKELVGMLMLLAFTSSPRRISIVHEAVNEESEKSNYLALGCGVLMQVAFKDMQRVAREVSASLADPSGYP